MKSNPLMTFISFVGEEYEESSSAESGNWDETLVCCPATCLYLYTKDGENFIKTHVGLTTTKYKVQLAEWTRVFNLLMDTTESVEETIKRSVKNAIQELEVEKAP